MSGRAMRHILLAAALALALPLAHADFDPACSGACASLLDEGYALRAQGKLGEALAKFKAAGEAAPAASAPWASAAGIFLDVSKTAKPADVAKLREQAQGLANAALKRKADDPVALEILRELADATPSPLRQANAAASSLINEAEVLFARRQYPAALAKYEEAMQRDPQFSGAWVGAGDCWYMQHDWAKAVPLFRRATEIEPRNSQAWRFLSDALAGQGKLEQAEGALLSGIAADPGQLPNWNKLAGLRSVIGKPLKPFRLQRAGVHVGADGKKEIQLAESLQKTSTPFDNAVRISLAVGEINARTSAAASRPSAFDIEMAAWKMALQAADEMGARDKEKPTDPALLAMQGMARDGQLEPAIFVLLYKEAYRPEYERWLAAHPDGVKAFIDRYGLRP
jgi:tetratricopeptide (TPR) repeat protein